MSRKTTTVTNCDYFNTMVLRDIDSKYNYRDLAWHLTGDVET